MSLSIRNLLCCTLAAAIISGTHGLARAADDKAFEARFVSFTKKYCTKCHGGNEPEAGFSLEVFKDLAAVIKESKEFKKVTGYVAEKTMPPEKAASKPSQAEIDDFVGYIDGELDAYYRRRNDPGRVTLRRLNRAEYQNTVRDLFGIDVPVANDLPQDDIGYGFDTIGDLLTISPLHLERYLAASEKVVSQAIVDPKNFRPASKAIKIEEMDGGKFVGGTRVLITNGDMAANFDVAGPGTYSIAIRAFGDQAGNEPVKMAILIDGNVQKQFEVKATRNAPQEYRLRIAAERPGSRRLVLRFLNDFYDPDSKDQRRRDRNLLVESIRLDGPLEFRDKDLPASHKRIVFIKPKNKDDRQATARKIVGNFARRAYRRQVGADEIGRLVKCVELVLENGDSFERGVQLALQAILVSPHFLYRVELDGQQAPAGQSQPIGEFELATRLSYFLWSTTPDDSLLVAANANELRHQLDEQVRRMIDSPKSRALIENFGGQWLETRKLTSIAPNRRAFKEFDDELRNAMRVETLMFFEHIMRDDRSILEFLDADYTFLNERLARHYGIPGVEGKRFRRVKLEGTQRGGVLTQATFLTITSNPTRTSPVKRGKWVLDQLLGTPPPPPPPNVPELKDNKKEAAKGTLRQRMEQHRSNVMCASCHQRMDPIGFAFENYDGIGRFRTKDGDFDVDSSGKLPTGESFDGPAGLKKILLSRKQLFVRCLAEKMLTFALGRGMEDYDKPTIETIADKVEKSGYKFSSMVLAVVHSEPFQKRRADK